MKMITAVIQPDNLDEVREALIAAEIYRITVSRCTGRGQAAQKDLYRGQNVAPDLLPKVRIDIGCNDEFVGPAIDAILSSAGHGSGVVGDGKIFVSALDQCIGIRTGETGDQAI